MVYTIVAKRGKIIPELLRLNKHNFLKKVNKQSSGCWEWDGPLDKDGYGIFVFYIGDGVPYIIRAHRAAYFFDTNTLLPSDIFVCHNCDNTSCVNPDHLFAGDNQANMDDMNDKDRGRSKLTKSDVIKIRQLLQADVKLTHTEVAKRFGVKSPTIGGIANYVSWPFIDVGPIPKRSKTNDQDRKKIKKLFMSGISARKIGVMFDICHHTVLLVVRNQKRKCDEESTL